MNRIFVVRNKNHAVIYVAAPSKEAAILYATEKKHVRRPVNARAKEVGVDYFGKPPHTTGLKGLLRNKITGHLLRAFESGRMHWVLVTRNGVIRARWVSVRGGSCP